MVLNAIIFFWFIIVGSEFLNEKTYKNIIGKYKYNSKIKKAEDYKN